MRNLRSVSRVLGGVLALALPFSAQAADIQFSSEDQARVGQIEQRLAPVNGFRERIDLASAQLLGTPYIASTLVGGPDTPEKLVVRFDGVDCYTFVDLARALALSTDKATFVTTLEKTRYHDGQVAYLDRRHFLTDWVAYAPVNARDVTSSLSLHVQVVRKELNRRADGGVYIKGLAPQPRDIAFLPPEFLTADVAAKIHTGDVIGIYTKLAGLDVTHTGLAIWKDGVLYFRNASSLKANMKVVDTPLAAYLKGKPGFLVLRMVEAG